ncbi:MAG: argininosuccinate synthase [Deltaproteobacteria bacterium RBG_13_61_14]|nr:MAG: argininosuccinate synthase [Deltaproteobacteria bacterium RBG_13_61_14]
MSKIVLAYSGGLDTSVILRWLLENYRAEVVALYVDLGQKEDLKKIRDKALRTGAAKFYAKDCREEFVRDFVFPALRANARYEDAYLMGTSLARPLIAKQMVEVARRERAESVAHGATGKGNDQVRFELTCMALEPKLKVIAPWREWKFTSRHDLVAYAKRHKIPVPVTQAKPYSSDGNLMHISYEGGILEDPWREPDESMFQMTVAPERAPGRPETITVSFRQGVPVAVNGKKLGPAKLLEHLNRLAGKHGIGRMDVVESRFVGMKSRGVYETPAGTVLHLAHRALETITLDREVIFLKDSLMPQYARLIYFGFWFSPEREALQKLIDETQKSVTGTVRLKLYKGGARVTGRKSPRSLYRRDVVSFDRKGGYEQSDATGFIRLQGLRLKIASLSKSKRP